MNFTRLFNFYNMRKKLFMCFGTMLFLVTLLMNIVFTNENHGEQITNLYKLTSLSSANAEGFSCSDQCVFDSFNICVDFDWGGCFGTRVIIV